MYPATSHSDCLDFPTMMNQTTPSCLILLRCLIAATKRVTDADRKLHVPLVPQDFFTKPVKEASEDCRRPVLTDPRDLWLLESHQWTEFSYHSCLPAPLPQVKDKQFLNQLLIYQPFPQFRAHVTLKNFQQAPVHIHLRQKFLGSAPCP